MDSESTFHHMFKNKLINTRCGDPNSHKRIDYTVSSDPFQPNTYI